MHPLDQYLKEKGSNRNRLATRCGLSPSNLSSYIRRNTKVENIPAKVIFALAKETDETMDHVYMAMLEFQNGE
ncbi:helix-turn-helix transcriptional regulator [Listeria ilorinensis]|uniref:helix-turn-helix transcriptional regulator n=1 Tax=Listeria ilorinensis TaxID=2867439 RepID=UPI001EF52C0B|nr:helix-turn-helix transcriptional regulator [Listeria ilorinensis]